MPCYPNCCCRRCVGPSNACNPCNPCQPRPCCYPVMGPQGVPGPTGNGIEDIEVTDNLDGSVTLTITYTDGTEQVETVSLVGDSLLGLEQVTITGAANTLKFVVEDALSAPLFQVDTTNSRVFVGPNISMASDATQASIDMNNFNVSSFVPVGNDGTLTTLGTSPNADKNASIVLDNLDASLTGSVAITTSDPVGPVAQTITFAPTLIAPSTGAITDLGSAVLNWNNINSQVAPAQPSDLRLKEDVHPSDLGLDFIDRLQPVFYRLKANQSGRFHYGLIAQEVKGVLNHIGKPTSDFAGYIEFPLEQPRGEDGEPDRLTGYALRYSEFISPLIQAVKDLKVLSEGLAARVGELEASKADLESRVFALENV